MHPHELADLASAIRKTAAALRDEADFVEPKSRNEADDLRDRALAFDTRAAEIERDLSAVQ